jgi:protein-S-isoprenylcysteine O-methyltransferase Ste14
LHYPPEIFHETDTNNMPPTSQDRGTSDAKETVTWRQLLFGAFIMTALPAAVLLGSSGKLEWWMAWVYIGMTTAFSLGSRMIMLRKYPGLIAERADYSDKDDAKPWDKTLAPLVAVGGPIAVLLAAGLDMRFGWSPDLPLSLQAAGLAVAALGCALGMWAASENRYFSAVVRIQRERGHSAVSSGPYRYIRHPGYAGGILAAIAMPLVLDSLWALVPAALLSGLLIVRTALEDKTLHEELSGYGDYAERVRYRLLPGVW